MTPPAPHVGHVSPREARRLADLLRQETVGGFLLIAAALVALVVANSPLADAYVAVRDQVVGPSALRLDLTVGEWTSDGLLALFFFLIGLELKRELVAGALRDLRRAVVPVAAAVGGVIVPALIYVALNRGNAEAVSGWPIPTATDIAFALAVLAVVGRGLPVAVRVFLLTLAVVDDLIAIAIIAIVLTTDLEVVPLLLAVIPLVVFGALVQLRPRLFERSMVACLVLLLPLALLTWVLVHASGVHATVAGVALALTVPVVYGDRDPGPHREREPGGLAEHLEHELRPLSAGVAVPLFAFFAAGVAVGGLAGLAEALSDPVAIGIVVGLVAGKPIGILGVTWMVTRLTGAELDDDLRPVDLVGMALVAGIGFTVSLLVADLTFGSGTPHDDHAKLAILIASGVATILAAIVFLARRRVAIGAGSRPVR